MVWTIEEDVCDRFFIFVASSAWGDQNSNLVALWFVHILWYREPEEGDFLGEIDQFHKTSTLIVFHINHKTLAFIVSHSEEKAPTKSPIRTSSQVSYLLENLVKIMSRKVKMKELCGKKKKWCMSNSSSLWHLGVGGNETPTWPLFGLSASLSIG